MRFRVWTVGFEGLERTIGSVAYASMPKCLLRTWIQSGRASA